MTTLEREGKHYSDEELRMLEEMVGSSNFDKIAAKLGRSPKAIERQLQRMGLYIKDSTGLLSAHEFSKIIGADDKVIVKWNKEHGLPMVTKSLRFKAGKKYTTWYIDPDKFWKWATKNKDVVNWTRYEQGALVPEPDWLNDKIAEQRLVIPKRQRQYWTPEEDKKAWGFYYQGVTQKEIAAILGRSVSSVERRLMRLREMKFKEVR